MQSVAASVKDTVKIKVGNNLALPCEDQVVPSV